MKVSYILSWCSVFNLTYTYKKLDSLYWENANGELLFLTHLYLTVGDIGGVFNPSDGKVEQ